MRLRARFVFILLFCTTTGRSSASNGDSLEAVKNGSEADQSFLLSAHSVTSGKAGKNIDFIQKLQFSALMSENKSTPLLFTTAQMSNSTEKSRRPPKARRNSEFDKGARQMSHRQKLQIAFRSKVQQQQKRTRNR